MNKFILSAIVCAGGLSKRMGDQNKVLLPYKGTVILSYVIEELLKSRVSEVIVVLGFEFVKAKAALKHFGSRIKVVQNKNYTTGQTSSIKAGLTALDSTSEGFMICMADMPLLECHHYNRVIDFFEQQNEKKDKLIIRPMVTQNPGHPVIMDLGYRESIFECQDKNGCRSVIEASKTSFIPFRTIDQAYIKDVDTPEVYDKLKSNCY